MSAEGVFLRPNVSFSGATSIGASAAMNGWAIRLI